MGFGVFAVVPVSGGEQNTVLLPDDVRSGAAPDLAAEGHGGALHQLLHRRLADEEGGGGFSDARLRGNTGATDTTGQEPNSARGAPARGLDANELPRRGGRAAVALTS